MSIIMPSATINPLYNQAVATSNSPSSQSTLCSSPALARSFSAINVGHLRFIVMDCPTADTLDAFAIELKVRGVCKVVRLCEPSYDASVLENSVAISVHDLAFPDGGTPPGNVISSFLALVEGQFGSLPNSLSKDIIQDHRVTIVDHAPVIAVHCVAGLGRAPLLVAIALIEAGFAPIDAVAFVRKCRRGAFNALQLRYLMDVYKKRPVSRLYPTNGFANFLKRAPSPTKDSSSTISSVSTTSAPSQKSHKLAADTMMAVAAPVKQSFFKKIMAALPGKKMEVPP